MISKRSLRTADAPASRRPITTRGAHGTAWPANRPAAQTATRLVVEHPVLVLSAAIIAGAFLGWLVKRR